MLLLNMKECPPPTCLDNDENISRFSLNALFIPSVNQSGRGTSQTTSLELFFPFFFFFLNNFSSYIFTDATPIPTVHSHAETTRH